MDSRIPIRRERSSMVNRDFRAGASAIAPLLPGVVPFAMVTGVATVGAGLSPAQAVGMSVVIFAGASQLAAVELLGENAPLAVVVVTAVVINLRMAMYSASIAPHFRRLRTRWRAVLAYLLTDYAYALSLTAYEDGAVESRRWYYLGVAVPLWAVWQVGTVVGAVLGAAVPARWGLGFVVPLMFLALLVPTLEDRPSVAAALAAGGVAVLGTNLPFQLTVLVGGLVGIAVGVAVERASDGSRTGTGESTAKATDGGADEGDGS